MGQTMKVTIYKRRKPEDGPPPNHPKRASLKFDNPCLICRHNLAKYHEVEFHNDQTISVFCAKCKGPEHYCQRPKWKKTTLLIAALVIDISGLIFWTMVNRLPLWGDILSCIGGAIALLWWRKQHEKKKHNHRNN